LFQDFVQEFRGMVISEGGHSGVDQKWEGPNIQLPLNVLTQGELRTPSHRGAAQITIIESGDLTVHMNRLFANDLSLHGYPTNTYSGSGELRRVLDIVERAKERVYIG
jgi:hypothetical protein